MKDNAYHAHQIATNVKAKLNVSFAQIKPFFIREFVSKIVQMELTPTTKSAPLVLKAVVHVTHKDNVSNARDNFY